MKRSLFAASLATLFAIPAAAHGVPGANGTYRVVSTRGGILSGEFTVGTPAG